MGEGLGEIDVESSIMEVGGQKLSPYVCVFAYLCSCVPVSFCALSICGYVSISLCISVCVSPSVLEGYRL